MYIPQKSWPYIERNPAALEKLNGAPQLACDIEWDIKSGEPTILGVSDGNTTVGIPFDSGHKWIQKLFERRPDLPFVGHNVLQADIPVLRGKGVNVDASKADDTILWWYLTHPNLCKTTKKGSDDESERRGAGFMSIYPMCSIFTSLPNWKVCRGDSCAGPCPSCDPFAYCATDSLGPLLALPGMKKLAAFRGVDRLYPLHRDLMVALGKMSEAGVLVDVPYVDRLRTQFEANRTQIRDSLPFNPESPKQVLAHFKALGLKSNKKDDIEAAVEDNAGVPELQALLKYKELGDGVDRWFAPREWHKGEWTGYVQEDGSIHCSFGPFTSSGRLQCSRPNLQNVAVRMGKEVRCAIIPREGCRWYKADYKAAEYRVFLHLAGYRDLPVNEDFHTWVAGLMEISSSDPFAQRMGGARAAAKSVTFGSLYGEGLQLKSPDDLRRGRVAEEIRCGARIVFKDWTFQDQVVTFTGGHLAQRAFGSATWQNRKRALEFQERFFGRFPKVRDLQRRITKQAERESMVRPPTGYCIPSYGYAEDRIKTALAIWGSNPVAHYSKHAILRSDGAGLNLRLQVHDELDAEQPIDQPPEKVVEMFREAMCFELPELKGLVLPIDVASGPSWGACETVSDNVR